MPKRNYSERTMASIAEYFKNRVDEKEIEKFIDDITWNDLDMDEIYKRLNYTSSKIGEECLYTMIREPLFDLKKIKSREEIIDKFSKNEEIRTNVQYHLSLLGKDYNFNLSNVFYNKFVFDTNATNYIIQAILPLILGAILYLTKEPLVGVILILNIIYNSKTYMDLKYIMEMELGVFEYLLSSVATLQKIGNNDFNLISQDYVNKINDLKIKLKPLIKNAATVVATVDDPFSISEILNNIFLYKAIAFKKTANYIMQMNGVLKEAYDLLGEIDCLIAIANYRESLNYYCLPDFLDQEGNNSIIIDKTYHPFVKDPVANSINQIKSMLITGSNASGKSTFLKTIAINAIFAQTIVTVLAQSYKVKLSHVITSMALKDNVLNNESYFIVEIKSLKRILNNVNNEIPCLVFVDEVLRGTNTIERISAAAEILADLTNQNCICFAATHDLELTNILAKFYDNFHFQEKIEDNSIKFDYKIYQGEAKTRNAIKLLKILGYSNNIVSRAEKMADQYIKKGIWQKLD